MKYDIAVLNLAVPLKLRSQAGKKCEVDRKLSISLKCSEYETAFPKDGLKVTEQVTR